MARRSGVLPPQPQTWRRSSAESVAAEEKNEVDVVDRIEEGGAGGAAAPGPTSGESEGGMAPESRRARFASRSCLNRSSSAFSSLVSRGGSICVRACVRAFGVSTWACREEEEETGRGD